MRWKQLGSGWAKDFNHHYLSSYESFFPLVVRFSWLKLRKQESCSKVRQTDFKKRILTIRFSFGFLMGLRASAEFSTGELQEANGWECCASCIGTGKGYNSRMVECYCSSSYVRMKTASEVCACCWVGEEWGPRSWHLETIGSRFEIVLWDHKGL